MLLNIFKCCKIDGQGVDYMAGRPPKQDKKIREAIYFEPELLEWLREEAEKQKCTVSIIVNQIVDEKKAADSE